MEVKVVYEVHVLLSEDFRATCFGYDPSVIYREAITLDIGAESEVEACEIAFAICNSTESERFCPIRYTADVKRYRAASNRSLSVGDACLIGKTTYAVETFGFKEVN